MKKLTISFLTLVLSLPALAQAKHNHHHHISAPPGIMGDHLHPKGDWMMSYSYMKMNMNGNRNGTTRLNTPLPGFMVSPLSMDMKMHMFGVMMGYNDNLTLMLMLPVLDISMDHQVNMNGTLFTTRASGIGDIKLSAMFKLQENWLANAGLNLPSGDINAKDSTPASSGNNVQLPYPMQLGSGSYEATAGISFIRSNQQHQWGNKADIVLRLNDNNRDYRLGNRLKLSSWYSQKLNPQSTLSARLLLQKWGNISGADTAPSINPAMVPTADTQLRAGMRADILVGFNYKLTPSYLLGIELGVPVYQNLDGPQLETDQTLQLAMQYDF